jgi:hypothetical protein
VKHQTFLVCIALLLLFGGCCSYQKAVEIQKVRACIDQAKEMPSCGDSSEGWEYMSRVELLHWAEACGADSVKYCLGLE